MIATVAGGDAWIDASVAGWVLAAYRQREPRAAVDFSVLTERQLAVLRVVHPRHQRHRCHLHALGHTSIPAQVAGSRYALVARGVPMWLYVARRVASQAWAPSAASRVPIRSGSIACTCQLSANARQIIARVTRTGPYPHGLRLLQASR